MYHYIQHIAHHHFCLQGTHMGNFQYSGEGVSRGVLVTVVSTVCSVVQCYIPDLKLKGHIQQHRVDPYLHDDDVGTNV